MSLRRHATDHPLRQASLGLYVVATILPLIAANVPGWGEDFNRTAVNLLGVAGVASVGLVRFFPWDRYDRNLFLVMSVSSAAVVALLVSFTGGSGSPFNAYFFLMIVFCALYYSRRVAVGIGVLIATVSLLPLLYGDPSRGDVLLHLVLAVSYMVTIWAGTAMAAKLAEGETTQRRLESDLAEIRALRDGLARRTTQLEAVHDVGRELVALLEEDRVCDALVRTLHERFRYSIVSLFLSDGDTADLVLAAQRGLGLPPAAVRAGMVRLGAGEGVSGHVVRTRRPYRTGDVTAVSFRKELDETPVRSELAVPLVSSGEVLGVLDVGSSEANAFDEADVVTLEAVADQSAIALCNARAHERLAAEAAADALTGLPNHREIVRRLDHEFAMARRHRRPFSLLFLDLDRFKGINDEWGHEAGDVVLREFAELAHGALRAGDTLGRYGGEEFIALLPEATGDEARLVAERLRTRIAGHAFRVPGGAHVTVSTGVATYPTHGTSCRELLRAADAALYAAKRDGRDRVCVAHAEPAGPEAEGAARISTPVYEPG